MARHASQGGRGAFQSWRARPRKRLSYVDRFYELNAYGIAVFIAFRFGVQRATQDGWAARASGCVLLLGGVVLLAIGVFYVRRPTTDSPEGPPGQPSEPPD